MSDPDERLKEVLGYAEDFLSSTAPTVASAELLIEALGVLKEREQTQARHFPAATHLPLLVFETLTGDWRGAVPLAAATTLIFVGVDVLDDLMDGDKSVHWRNRPAGEVLLGAATLLSAAPQALLADSDAPPEIRTRIQGLLARGMLEMSAGQLADIRHTGSAFVALDDVVDSVNAKSGAMLATFASMAAALAGLGAPDRDHYAELGRTLGVASQLRSDCRDLYGAHGSRDLANRTRTAPIAMRLEQLEGGERSLFLERLEAARKGGVALAALRRELADNEILEDMATLIELYCEAARQLAKQEAASNQGCAGLQELIDETSMLGPAGETGGSDGSQEDA